MPFKKTDILPAAELLERTADAFESQRIEWMQGEFGYVPPKLYRNDQEANIPVKPQACLIGGLAMEAGVWYDTHNLQPVITVGGPALASRSEDEIRQFALARRAAAQTIKGLTVNVSCRTHVQLVGAWNDDEETTLGEVVDVLKHAAKDLRNQASAA